MPYPGIGSGEIRLAKTALLASLISPLPIPGQGTKTLRVLGTHRRIQELEVAWENDGKKTVAGEFSDANK